MDILINHFLIGLKEISGMSYFTLSILCFLFLWQLKSNAKITKLEKEDIKLDMKLSNVDTKITALTREVKIHKDYLTREIEYIKNGVDALRNKT